MAKILILNGPNLNLLGQREPNLYGNQTLSAVLTQLTAKSKQLSHDCLLFQSNSEGELIDRIHSALSEQIEFIIINPAGLTHTSVSLRDALLAVAIPFIEVHISNVFAREPFRQHSYFSDVAVGVISGLGIQGYELALLAAHEYLTNAGS